MLRSLVGSEMCIRDRSWTFKINPAFDDPIGDKYKLNVAVRKANSNPRPNIYLSNFQSEIPLACKILISFSEYKRPKVRRIPNKKAKGNANSKNPGIL